MGVFLVRLIGIGFWLKLVISKKVMVIRVINNLIIGKWERFISYYRGGGIRG